MNFPCRGAGEIQSGASKNQNCPTWRELETEFLTLASELCGDAKWQKLIQDINWAGANESEP